MPKKEAAPDLQRLLTIKKTAEILDCSEKSVRRKIAEGKIEAMKDGNIVRVVPDRLWAYIRSHRI